MDNNEGFNSRIDLSEITSAFENIKTEIKKVVVGQEKMIELLTIGLFCEGHILLEGFPGVAKTLAAKCLAKTVDAGFNRIQFTPDLMPSDVVGTMVYNVNSGVFNFKQGPVFSNIILIDEINRAPAKTQAALFECMEEQQVTIDGTNHPLAGPFMVIGTQNPIDHEGTYMLPEAQLDRFMFKLNVNYPTVDEEIEMLAHQQVRDIKLGINDIHKALTVEKLRKVQEVIKSVAVKEELFKYIIKIIHGTRTNPALLVGASPRASIHILMASKTRAALQGRDFVVPEDIKEVAMPVLIHRVTLTPEKEMEGLTVNEVLKNSIQKVEVPR